MLAILERHSAARRHDQEFHLSKTGESQGAGSSRRNIDYPPARERSTVVDPHHYRTMILGGRGLTFGARKRDHSLLIFRKATRQIWQQATNYGDT